MNEGKGSRVPIDHWESVELLHKDDAELGRESMSIEIEVQRPIFEDGRKGRPSMGMVICRGERMLRLFCPRGSTAEISTLRGMLFHLDDELLRDFEDRFDRLESRDRQSGRPTGSRAPRPGEVGGGLSRFTRTPKRDRRRRGRDDGNSRSK